MANKSSQTIADRLNAAQLAISNTLTDTEIQSLVSAYGYNEAKMNEGKQLYDTPSTLSMPKLLRQALSEMPQL